MYDLLKMERADVFIERLNNDGCEREHKFGRASMEDTERLDGTSSIQRHCLIVFISLLLLGVLCFALVVYHYHDLES